MIPKFEKAVKLLLTFVFIGVIGWAIYQIHQFNKEIMNPINDNHFNYEPTCYDRKIPISSTSCEIAYRKETRYKGEMNCSYLYGCICTLFESRTIINGEHIVQDQLKNRTGIEYFELQDQYTTTIKRCF